MEEDSNICFRFKRIEDSDLQKSIESLKYQTETNISGTVSYTTSESHLITAVSQLPLYVSRYSSVSALITGCGEQEVTYNYYGTIKTGYIPNWR